MEGLQGGSHTDWLSLLSEVEIQNLKCVAVIPFSVTIGDLIGGIVAADHIDNIGLQSSHGETVVRYGINTNQLKGGVTFVAFAGQYRWRSNFIEFFDFD